MGISLSLSLLAVFFSRVLLFLIAVLSNCSLPLSHSLCLWDVFLSLFIWVVLLQVAVSDLAGMKAHKQQTLLE